MKCQPFSKKKLDQKAEAILHCETCHKRVESLTEEEALNDLEGHGWTNHETAQHIKCFDCATNYDEYETYYAGRIKRGYPNRVWQKLPDVKTGKEIDGFFVREKVNRNEM